MPFMLEDLIENLHGSRRFLLKHLNGVREDQWDWKPYPECNSIRETLAHLVSDDRAAVNFIEKGDPDYEHCQVEERDIEKLKAMLEQSHAAVCEALRAKFADTPLDTPVDLFHTRAKLGNAIGMISIEDCYHAGQVAFIRIATDPGWNYYGAIYGG